MINASGDLETPKPYGPSVSELLRRALLLKSPKTHDKFNLDSKDSWLTKIIEKDASKDDLGTILQDIPLGFIRKFPTSGSASMHA